MMILICFQSIRVKAISSLVGFMLFSLFAGCNSDIEKQVQDAEEESRQTEELYKERAEEIREAAKEKESIDPTREFLKALSEDFTPENKQPENKQEEEK